MRKWGPSLIAGFAVMANVVLGAISSAQNAQLIKVCIPQQYLAANYLLGGFGVALLLVYIAAKATHPSPAAIRLRLHAPDSVYPFLATNVGESEANEVIIQPITFGNFPWSASSKELGSIPAKGNPEHLVAALFAKCAGQVCQPCLHRDQQAPRNLNEFLVRLGEHVAEDVLKEKRPLSAGESLYILADPVGLFRRFQLYFAVSYYNGLYYSTAHHRLDGALLCELLDGYREGG